MPLSTVNLRRQLATMAAPVALAGCAGAVDLLALAGLGGVFASVVTGNLVVVGLGLGRLDEAILRPALVAIVGYTVGVAAWQWTWRRRPTAVTGPLVVECGLLVVVTVAWWVEHSHPKSVAALTLLSIASLAMGGQSVVALRLHAATTYLTGTLTGAVHDLVTGHSGRRAQALGQLAALAAGATGAAALLAHQRWATPLLPMCLSGIAVASRIVAGQAPRAR